MALTPVPNETTQGEQRRTAFDIVEDVARGGVVSKLTDALNAVALAVIDTGKKGKVNLELALSSSETDENVVVIDAKIRTATPEHDMRSMFFVDRTGNLTREDPRQNRIDI